MVYIDALGNVSNYKKNLQAHFKFNFTIEAKADATYEVVFAARLLAKINSVPFFSS